METLMVGIYLSLTARWWLQLVHLLRSIGNSLGLILLLLKFNFLLGDYCMGGLQLKQNYAKEVSSWLPPPSGSLKFNVDGAVIGSFGAAGIGGIMRDETGKVLVNLQLLASCYMQNNQAYSACHILKGMQTTQSRNLFVMPCFQMDLLNEAETVLCSANDPGGEIPNGAAGHYLLGLICWLI